MLDLSMILQATILSGVSILFDTILPLGTVLCDTICPCVIVLSETIVPLGKVLRDTVLCETIVPLVKMVCYTVLSFGFYVEGYGKEVWLSNLSGNKFDEEDVLGDSNDNRCWREELICVNVVKKLFASGYFLQEKTKADLIRKKAL